VTSLVCLNAFIEAGNDLEQARRRYAEAALALTISREKLDQGVDHAFEQPSFRPIEALVCEAEAAQVIYRQAVTSLVAIEERWFAVRAALAYEQAVMLAGPVPRQRLQ
jgi:hypothetical protein